MRTRLRRNSEGFGSAFRWSQDCASRPLCRERFVCDPIVGDLSAAELFGSVQAWEFPLICVFLIYLFDWSQLRDIGYSCS